VVAQLAGVGALARGQCDSEKCTDLVITTTLEASHDEKMEARTLANAANDNADRRLVFAVAKCLCHAHISHAIGRKSGLNVRLPYFDRVRLSAMRAFQNVGGPDLSQRGGVGVNTRRETFSCRRTGR
jgi:hypothetical protein